MAAARCIAVGQLVDQHQLGRIGQEAIEVHLGQRYAAIFQVPQRLLRQAGEHGLGFRTAVGFDHADAQIDALALLRLSRLQHGEGLAHTGCRAEEDLEPATPLAGHLGQQRIGAQRITHGVFS